MIQSFSRLFSAGACLFLDMTKACPAALTEVNVLAFLSGFGYLNTIIFVSGEERSALNYHHELHIQSHFNVFYVLFMYNNDREGDIPVSIVFTFPRNIRKIIMELGIFARPCLAYSLLKLFNQRLLFSCIFVC